MKAFFFFHSVNVVVSGIKNADFFELVMETRTYTGNVEEFPHKKKNM